LGLSKGILVVTIACCCFGCISRSIFRALSQFDAWVFLSMLAIPGLGNKENVISFFLNILFSVRASRWNGIFRWLPRLLRLIYARNSFPPVCQLLINANFSSRTIYHFPRSFLRIWATPIIRSSHLFPWLLPLLLLHVSQVCHALPFLLLLPFVLLFVIPLDFLYDLSDALELVVVGKWILLQFPSQF